ncbi:MAG TPA: PEGA domain-containing protein [Polyangiaceae bacterium]|nr:PEGA domain-containing protein [Polyangiaceae bacterium]
MHRVLWILTVLGLLAVLVPARTASAQGVETTARLEAIRKRMEAGQARYLAGDYAEAARLFEEGYRAHPYSAFLFNAGVCRQKLGDLEQALARFRDYLTVDPNAPDRDKVLARIAALEAELARQAEAKSEAEKAGAPEAPAAVDGAMKALVVIETEPAGAPLRLYARIDPTASPFQVGGENPGWLEVAATTAPTNLTLDVGRYHVVVEKFQDLNLSETDIDVLPGHVHHFKANLSQGEFMAFLRVTANVPGATVHLDDASARRPPWGSTPHGELVRPGRHSVRVAAPGFEPVTTWVELARGEQKLVEVELSRVDYGFLRLSSNAPEFTVRIGTDVFRTLRSGDAPLEVRLPAGVHPLVVSSEGRKPFHGEVEIPRGRVQPAFVRLIPTYPRGAAWVQAILSAACVGTGVYLGVESNRLYSELEADRRLGVLAADDSRVTKGRWFSIGANVGFGAGGILGALATYNFVKDPLPESSVRLSAPEEFPKEGERPGAPGGS